MWVNPLMSSDRLTPMQLTVSRERRLNRVVGAVTDPVLSCGSDRRDELRLPRGGL
jgi:hypothetical protein